MDALGVEELNSEHRNKAWCRWSLLSQWTRIQKEQEWEEQGRINIDLCTEKWKKRLGCPSSEWVASR